MDDIRLALLGDKAAQERVTERGELVPCMCGGKARLIYHENGQRYSSNITYFTKRAHIRCDKCGVETKVYGKSKRAMKAWNTRPALLTPTQFSLLQIGMEPRKFERFEHDRHTSD